MMRISKNKGFTLIELMLVMAIASVMLSLKMKDDQLEATQLEARKLGATELFTYNLGVQKYLSDIAGVRPAPTDYPKFYTGVDWLKNAQCANPALPATPEYLPCRFLRNSGGKTTTGAMSFATTIDYDPSSGYTARTVLSQMAGTGASENNSGILGMAALVASGSFSASGSGGTGGNSIVYCPDLSPMPSGMAAICGLERDQIVMLASTNGTNDYWLRVDHGNMMQHAIEMSENPTALPATDSDLASVHSNMRQIRNVARIYNFGAGSENLYLGSRKGVAAEFGATGSTTTLANNAVIIDADQEILGLLKVQGTIEATGTITSDEDIIATRDLRADRSIISGQNLVVGNNASVNGWIVGQGDITSMTGDIVSSAGDIVATNGVLMSSRFVDSDNTGYYSNPSATSNINAVNVRGRLNALGSAYVGIVRSEGSSCSPNGSLARTSAGKLLSCVSGSWAGGGGGNLVASKPFGLGTSGTNTSGRPMMVYARGYATYTSPHAVIVMRVTLKVCGTLVGYGSMAPRSNWYTSYDTASGIVPAGCSWSVGVSSTASSQSVTVYGQYLYVQ